ncbi:MAG: hypothetical protein OXC48_01495 [Endozoicomonadaceae bacterium]|nr:hypothetical protein [Endozoicomonadaceae bacterium]
MKNFKFTALFLMLISTTIFAQSKTTQHMLTVVNYIPKVITVMATGGIFKGQCGDAVKPHSETLPGTPNIPTIKKISWNDVTLLCGQIVKNKQNLCKVYAYFDDTSKSYCSGLRSAIITMDLETGVMEVTPLVSGYTFNVSTPYKLIIKKNAD